MVSMLWRDRNTSVGHLRGQSLGEHMAEDLERKKDKSSAWKKMRHLRLGIEGIADSFMSERPQNW